MGTRATAEIDSWLQAGGIVLAASDRAARFLRDAFHLRRRQEGLAAWPEPAIHSFSEFVQSAWLQRTPDDRLLLNSAQEQYLWARIAASEDSLLTSLEQPLHNIASLAAEAHQLLCNYAPRLLRTSARAGWGQNAEKFSAWLAAFDALCARERLLSPARLSLDLLPLLDSDASARPPLLLAGFDRILPAQRSLFDAWGRWQALVPPAPAANLAYYAAADSASELDACARWCMHRLSAHPGETILVLSQSIATQRGQIERAFLRAAPVSTQPRFEFSLGVPLSSVPLARAAFLLLRWLAGPLQEHEVDWLFSSGFLADAQESAALQARMRAIRKDSLESPQWVLADFLNLPGVSPASPASWLARVTAAQRRLAPPRTRTQSPLDWATLVPQLLGDFGLPRERRLSSPEYQAYERLQQALDTCASLAFLGQQVSWPEFLSAFERILRATLFTPQSTHASILIAGPSESAGLTADALWFLGADQDTWPARASTHPLIPLAVQREYSMPHSTAFVDLELAQTVTTRLFSSVSVVRCSFARLHESAEAFPSSLLRERIGDPQPLPLDLTAPVASPPLLVPFADESLIPFSRLHATAPGGAALLTAQSQCAFKAFAVHRLKAQDWQPAEAGLTAAQRGKLLHAVLRSIWHRPSPQGLRTSRDLLAAAAADLHIFVQPHVQQALRSALPSSVLARMPFAYLEIEAERLTYLVSQWLDYEAHRLPFTVEQTEESHTISLAGLTLKVRLDRLDRLHDQSLLVIDYKTGKHDATEWDAPRPEDTQLPLYASFALPPEETLGGLAFAQLRAGELKFAGRLRNARSTLIPSLASTSSLVKSPLTGDQVNEWKTSIEALARDFLSGRADVDPLDPVKTCERCGLYTLCRIASREELLDNVDDDAEDDDA